MFVRFFKAAAVIVMLLAGGSAPARPEAPSVKFLNRVDELVRWISERSDYPVTLKNAPVFVFLTPETIRHSFAGSLMGYSEKHDVKAAQAKDKIILPDNFMLGRDDYMLVHELVHYLQYESGKTFSCLEEREREAYVLQTAFVIETGAGNMPNDMFMMMLRCDIR
ncbi:MAG: hypothetical protein ACT4N4_05030 [Rhodospirillales bacterium]